MSALVQPVQSAGERSIHGTARSSYALTALSPAHRWGRPHRLWRCAPASSDRVAIPGRGYSASSRTWYLAITLPTDSLSNPFGRSGRRRPSSSTSTTASSSWARGLRTTTRPCDSATASTRKCLFRLIASHRSLRVLRPQTMRSPRGLTHARWTHQTWIRPVATKHLRCRCGW